jgi:hypothetical protein
VDSARKKLCRPIHVSSFMNAQIADMYLSLKRVTVVYSARMVAQSAHRYKRLANVIADIKVYANYF